MIVEKRYKKVDHVVLCQRCQTENQKFEVTCAKCGANLIHAGKKRWKTTPISMLRIPFKFPKKEPTTLYLRRRLELAKQKGWSYLFLNPSTDKPITDVCFWDHFILAGQKVGVEMWPHRCRAERCKQLREEYEFTKDDLKRFTMIVADRTLEIYAGTSLPYEKKMGIT